MKLFINQWIYAKFQLECSDNKKLGGINTMGPGAPWDNSYLNICF